MILSKIECMQINNMAYDLGEGLVWDTKSLRLLMTDILNGTLVELDIDSLIERRWTFNEPLGWVLPTSTYNRYLLGFKSGIALFNLDYPNDVFWVSRDILSDNNCRLNDACVDSTGRVWFGSMNMHSPSSKDGKLISFTAKDGLFVHDAGFTVTNGPLVSPDGQYLFCNDTLQGLIYRYPLLIDSGRLGSRQVFAKFNSDQGYPDGMCFDIDGNLWVALWGGASIVRLDSKGQLIRKIPIPALNVTNICFCGSDLSRLMVSSASIGLSEDEANQYPTSGSLFEVTNHCTTGVKTFSAALDSSWT